MDSNNAPVLEWSIENLSGAVLDFAVARTIWPEAEISISGQPQDCRVYLSSGGHFGLFSPSRCLADALIVERETGFSIPSDPNPATLATVMREYLKQKHRGDKFPIIERDLALLTYYSI